MCGAVRRARAWCGGGVGWGVMGSGKAELCRLSGLVHANDPDLSSIIT